MTSKNQPPFGKIFAPPVFFSYTAFEWKGGCL